MSSVREVTEVASKAKKAASALEDAGSGRRNRVYLVDRFQNEKRVMELDDPHDIYEKLLEMEEASGVEEIESPGIRENRGGGITHYVAAGRITMGYAAGHLGYDFNRTSNGSLNLSDDNHVRFEIRSEECPYL